MGGAGRRGGTRWAGGGRRSGSCRDHRVDDWVYSIGDEREKIQKGEQKYASKNTANNLHKYQLNDTMQRAVFGLEPPSVRQATKCGELGLSVLAAPFSGASLGQHWGNWLAGLNSGLPRAHVLGLDPHHGRV